MKIIGRYIHSLILPVLLTAVFSSAAARDFVVVLDPGHGGKDVGAVGKKAREKDINLAVALELGALIKKNQEDVKVVYTRDDDTFISLQERANIANKAHGDLFISIHTNSVDRRSKNRLTVHGAATYTLGLHRSDDNLAVAIRENSVIELEEDYSAKYSGFNPNSAESYIIFELSQNKHMEQSVDFASLVQQKFADSGRKDNGVRQAGFWVLAQTGMPAVLVELDFICNPEQERFLSSDSGQKKLAKAIYKAFVEYKGKNGVYPAAKPSGTSQKPVKRENDKRSAEKSQPEKVIYKIQFLTSAKKLPKNSPYLKGLKNVDSYRDGGVYKYVYGETDDKEEAQKNLKAVRKKFKEAFIVEFKNGKRIK